MSNLTILGDTSGSVVLQAPAVSGSTTITMPAATGTMMVSGNMPAFSAWQSSQQTLSANTYTKINFQTEEFDTNNNFASSRFTPTVAGYYQLTTCITVGASATNIILVIYKNGSSFKWGFYNGGVGTLNACNMSTLVSANGSTDYYEVYASFGTGQVVDANSEHTYFQGCLVRAA
jgi:hypothetical protein